MKRTISAAAAAALLLASLPAPASAADDGYIYHDTFESGAGDWSNRGACEVSVSGTNACAGEKSLFVSGRSDSWNGASKPLDSSEFVPGSDYAFSASVLAPKEGREVMFHLTLQYEAGAETHYDKIVSGSAYGGSWMQLVTPSFTIPSGATDLQIYVETDKGTDDFYIDELIAAPAGTVIAGVGAGARPLAGDVTCDGVIDAFDMVAARQGFVNGFGSKLAEKNCDVDGDTVVSEEDVINIGKFLMGEITEFPYVGPPEPPKSDYQYTANIQYHEAPGSYFSQSGTKGKLIKESYNGINGSNQLNVYLPPDYDESKKYNIFYLMHGGGEDENVLINNTDNFHIDYLVDHMIQSGEVDPMIVVFPTFNKTEAGQFYKELRQSVIPFVEGKYSTYAGGDTSDESIRASRMHRAYGGFSMGAVSTWAVFANCLDIVGYYMPLSGDHWSGNSAQDKANDLARAIDKSGLTQRDYFIFAATGDDDIAYPNIGPQIEAMKPMSQYYTYTSDFSEGNLYFLVAPGKTHWWGYVKHYIYDALPNFFREGQ